MKRYLHAAWTALLLSFVSTTVSATVGHDIDVQLIPHSTEGKTSSTVVTVLIRNVGNAVAYIPKPLSPLDTPADHLMTDLFSIKDVQGQRARFIGRFVRVMPEDPGSYFVKINAGQSVSVDVDLSRDYDLSAGGAFSVSYTQNYSLGYSITERGEISSNPQFQKSEEAVIWVNPTASAEIRRNRES